MNDLLIEVLMMYLITGTVLNVIKIAKLLVSNWKGEI